MAVLYWLSCGDACGFAWLADVGYIGYEFAAHYFKAPLIAIKYGCCQIAFPGLSCSRGATKSSCFKLQNAQFSIRWFKLLCDPTWVRALRGAAGRQGWECLAAVIRDFFCQRSKTWQSGSEVIMRVSFISRRINLNPGSLDTELHTNLNPQSVSMSRSQFLKQNSFQCGYSFYQILWTLKLSTFGLKNIEKYQNTWLLCFQNKTFWLLYWTEFKNKQANPNV